MKLFFPFFLVLIAALNACVSPSMGRVSRFDVHGQQVICWEPSNKMNNFAAYVANKMEDR